MVHAIQLITLQVKKDIMQSKFKNPIKFEKHNKIKIKRFNIRNSEFLNHLRLTIWAHHDKLYNHCHFMFKFQPDVAEEFEKSIN